MQVYILRERARTAELVAPGRRRTATAPWCSRSTHRSRGCACASGAPGVHLPDDLALPNLAGDSTESARGGGFMAVVTHEFEPALTPRRHRVAGRAERAARRRQGRAARRRRRALRGGRRGGRGGLEPRRPPAGRRAGRPPTSWPRSSTPWPGGPRSTSTAACAARPTWSRRWRSGPGPCWSGRPSLWALATGGADGRGRAAALVRGRAAAGHGPVRRGHGGRRSTAAWCGGRRGGRSAWSTVTTVAAMLAARAEDDRPGCWTPAAAGPGARPWRRGRPVARWRARSWATAAAPHRGAAAQRRPSTCSGSTAPRWPARPSSGSTRPDGARPWRPTCGPPTAP